MIRRLHIVLLLTLSGCATMPMHKPVPEQLSEHAVVSGFSERIRFWADEAPIDFMEATARRSAEYRKRNESYYQSHNAYPPLNYLAISGGAYDGAFGAGLLSGWSASGHRPDFALVTGVSTGALIAPFVFIGSKYDPQLRDLFTQTSSDNIFITDVWKMIGGITGGLALTDSTPLAKKIAGAVTPEILALVAAEHKKGKQLYIGTTNIEAQRGIIWDIGEIASSGHPDALNLVHQIMLASASVPGIFQPVFIDVEIDGKSYQEIHADGGITSQVFAYPMKLSRDTVDEYKRYGLKRSLYIVRNSKIVPEYKEMEPGLFSLSARSLETLIKSQGLGDLYRLYVGAKRDGVEYNLLSIPEDFKEKSNELFDPVYMGALFDVGYAMGKRQDAWQHYPPGAVYVTDDEGNTTLTPAPIPPR